MRSLVSQVSSWLGSTSQSWMMELHTGVVQRFKEGEMKPICVFQTLTVPPTCTLIQHAETAGGKCTKQVQLLPKLSFSEPSGTGSVKRLDNPWEQLYSHHLSQYALPVPLIGMKLFWDLHKLVCLERAAFKSHLFTFHVARNFSQNFHDLNLLIMNSYILLWFNSPFWSLWMFSVLSSDAFILLKMLCPPCNFILSDWTIFLSSGVYRFDLVSNIY